MDTTTERIRALNDQLRTSGEGGDIVATRGIATLELLTKATIFAAVQSFDSFTPDNDPYGEHDFGLLEVAGERVMFKIDYYDRAMAGHSPDASDPAVTRRVLTIMLASEY
jgi:Protein of unknown function (DUF3768)